MLSSICPSHSTQYLDSTVFVELVGRQFSYAMCYYIIHNNFVRRIGTHTTIDIMLCYTSLYVDILYR
jgi:hypothetical protein